MSSKSKKGYQFERNISKFLSKWIQGSDNPLLFWRQILSGGMMKVKKNNMDENLSGDIHAIHKNGEFLTNFFSIELKAGYKDASFDKFTEELTSDKMEQFWTQACTDAKKANKRPILIFNKLRGMTVIGFTEEIVNKLDLLTERKLTQDMRCLHLRWEKSKDLLDVYFFDMNKFFETVSVDIMKNVISHLDNATMVI